LPQINIALADLEVIGRPSRCTFSLAQWLEERHTNVYPKMEGYKSSMVGGGAGPAFLDVRTPIKLPDALRGEKYAFVALPLAEFKQGGSINESNIGMGRVCQIPSDLPADAFVQGVVIFSSRAKALASWLAGTEVAGLTADLRKRNLVMETNIDTQYLMARLNEEQRKEGGAFEEGKEALGGLHFLCVQKGEDDDPTGFWLLRDLPTGI
jgi:RNA-binding protein Tab2/Atab2